MAWPYYTQPISDIVGSCHGMTLPIKEGIKSKYEINFLNRFKISGFGYY